MILYGCSSIEEEKDMSMVDIELESGTIVLYLVWGVVGGWS